MNLRFATRNDIDAIMNIEKQSFLPQIQEERNLFLKRIDFFNKGFVLMENSDSKTTVSGYMCCELWKKISFSESKFKIGHDIEKFHCDSGKNLYISSFAILPECRGKGIGKIFFTEALKLIHSKHEIERIMLVVNSEWLGARHIYASSGFKELYVIKELFPSEGSVSSDGIVMGKLL